MEKIYLIGFMGAGKSTIGRELSASLGWRFVDTDSLIEKKCDTTIKEIFSEKGEVFFRVEEREILRSLNREDRIVVATGGGMPVFFDNLSVMKKNGFVVYLYLPFDKLKERLEKDGEKKIRPLAWQYNLEKMLKFRESYYRRAHYVCDTDGVNPLEAATKIKEAYKRWKK